MPSQPTVTQTRLNNIAACLAVATDTVDTLSDNFNTTFLHPISRTIQSLLILIQTAKQNKSTCALLLEQVNEVLYAIAVLHIESNPAGELTPTMLHHIGDFTMTLHKIHTFVEAQQDGSVIKKIFHQGEMNTLLKDCNIGLQRAFEIFKVQAGDILKRINDMQKHAAEIHQQVLDLIESLSDTTSSDTASSINNVFSSSYSSSNSLSMLPSEPKIFYGRETELAEIVKLFMHTVPRIAILGAGGMGKTSLARAVLHCPDLTLKYQEHRYFVTCESASTQAEFFAAIGAYLGLKSGKDLQKQIIHHFSHSPPCLLFLDNLETVWEPTSSRTEIEEFLSLLTDIKHLALIITMRGAERPAHVHWTHPFLQPLQSLTQDAARRAFLDIADETLDSEDIDKALSLTDNMPLAIDLVAHLVDSQGYSAVLSQWEAEKTGLFSEGYDRRSNLDLSISLSLSSPRLTSVPFAKELLSLLSMLPDGLSDTELLHSNLPVDNILHCKAALLRTSLAYNTSQKRLKLLVPIQEHMRKYHPPKLEIVDRLFHNYEKLVDLFKKHHGSIGTSKIISQITSNFANIQNILSFRLQHEYLDHSCTIYCGINLNTFSRVTGGAQIPFMAQIPTNLPRPTNHRLEVYFKTECFAAYHFSEVPNPAAMIEHAYEHMLHFSDLDIKCRFYNSVGHYYLGRSNHTAATDSFQRALSLSISTGDTQSQSSALRNLALNNWKLGDYTSGQVHAAEAQKIARLGANLYNEAMALQIEAICLSELGNYPQSIAQCKRAKSLVTLCGMSGGVIDHDIMTSLAEIHKLKSEYTQAQAIRAEILHTWPIEQNPVLHAITLLNIAEIDVSMGAQKRDVQRNIDVARQILKTIGLEAYIAMCDATEADLCLREKNMLDANKIFKRSLKLSLGKSNEMTIYCLERLADVHRWSAIYWTNIWPALYLVHALNSNQKLNIYKALKCLGDIICVEGDQSTAISLYTVALEGFTQMDVHCSRAECMLRLGDMSKGDGDFEKAEGYWKTARLLFGYSSQGKKVVLIDERLATMGNDV
ncbi:hypothetical protein GGX14DRAFT_546373 [Mycena pura]|uniref:Novel STAND NTPase 1 domain-containing protein n=1 Tax=Mycena pura TaxID=153505 RepID=A0AAD6UYK6_9AGAR|nr:hypothetical protein GGX14DRAFT_546373 [Mycena pura]